MTQPATPLFDFAPFKDIREDYRALIKQFAAHEEYRSAVVDELELDEDFYRRPLRPEDLDFLKFSRAVRTEAASQLPALASNRLLLCINELDVARLPRGGSAAELQRFERFYSDDNRVLGARIRPFLENYAFSHLSGLESIASSAVDSSHKLQALYRDEEAFWSASFERLQHSGYLIDGLRFIIIQLACLMPSKRCALARATASGFFDMLAPCDRPGLGTDGPEDVIGNALTRLCDVSKRAHSYWQFYLPTSFAQTNLLYALAARPDRAFSLCGAAFAAEAQRLAFESAVKRACPHLFIGQPPRSVASAGTIEELITRFERAFAAIEALYDAEGTTRVSQGLAAGTAAAATARTDLGEHLRWLGSIDDYVRHAHTIHDRILAECPDIDRETFVEPREMCSTTHVHNDHRLVVIETGDMVFWGNLGMQLKMKPGDMVLIPCGRLHGSTVVSDECVYHQPIIPDEWLAELIREPDAPRAIA